ncbi:GNAT family N-acetyltransferase [Nonomuraea phyllanthi]|uniref:GNAT family N-acetyltransferase n=1 Tax=Nonomuraea phyllanthi TaxID=2219224 RepID=UPI001884A54D|nr:GNAT family N-acetyltransferase [Nonomuraea phyllanthi]
MIEIDVLTESDRACREAPAHGKDAYFDVERGDDDYERTWRRLLDDEQVRGVAARLDGMMAGIAHHLIHAGVWYAGRCGPVPEHGGGRPGSRAVRPRCRTALYDKVGRLHEGLILYSYRRDANRPHDAAPSADPANAAEHLEKCIPRMHT